MVGKNVLQCTFGKTMAGREMTQDMVDLICMTKKQKRKLDEVIYVDLEEMVSLDLAKTFGTKRRFLPIPLLCWKCLFAKRMVRRMVQVEDIVEEIFSYITYSTARWILSKSPDDEIDCECIGAYKIYHNPEYVGYSMPYELAYKMKEKPEWVRYPLVGTQREDSDNGHATKRFKPVFLQ